MKKVSSIWRILFFVMIGYALGTFVTIKYMVPPTTAITLGKVKLRGSDNTISDILDVNQGDDRQAKREDRKEARQEKKDIRKQKRAEKKEARKGNTDAE